MYGFLAIVLSALLIVFAWDPYIQNAITGLSAVPGQIGDLGPDEPDQQVGCTIPLDKAWKITLNKNTGGDVGSSSNTGDLFSPDTLANYEADLDPSASGVITTGKTYSSGDNFHLRYVNSNTKQWFNNLQVPFHCVDTDSNHFTTLTSFAIGTYVISITESGNTTVKEASATYNYTTRGTTPTFNIDVENTADNTGYLSSVDLTTGRTWNPILLVWFNGTGFDSVTMKSAGFTQDGIIIDPEFKETATKRIYVIDLTENQLTRQVRDDGTVTKQGRTSISFQPNLAGVSVDTVDMYVQLAGYTSSGEVVQFNSATSNDGVSLKDFLINIKS
jgi:hypothetical protein